MDNLLVSISLIFLKRTTTTAAGSGGLSASQVDMELLVSNFLQYKAIRKKADLGKKCFSEGRFLQVIYAFSHVKTELPHWTRNFYGKPLSLKKQCLKNSHCAIFVFHRFWSYTLLFTYCTKRALKKGPTTFVHWTDNICHFLPFDQIKYFNSTLTKSGWIDLTWIDRTSTAFYTISDS